MAEIVIQWVKRKLEGGKRNVKDVSHICGNMQTTQGSFTAGCSGHMRQRFLPQKFAELVEIMETSDFIRRGCPGASAVCLLDVCFMQTLFLFGFVGLLF